MKGIQARAVQDTVAARASLIRKLQLWLFALVLSAPLLVPTSVTLASGYEAIGGVAYTSEVKTYGYPRYVTNPASPGPEVAFYWYGGTATGLWLGTWACTGYPGPIYAQSWQAWSAVAYFSSFTKFCMATWSNGSSGNFSGDLNWD